MTKETKRPFIVIQPGVWEKDGPLPYPIAVERDATIANSDALGGKYVQLIGFCDDPDVHTVNLTYPSFLDNPQSAVGRYTVVADKQRHYFTMGGPVRDVKVVPARQCFYVFESQFTDGKGYTPSIVTENQAGHQPLSGKDDTQTPYYWGMTLGEARKVARQANEHSFNLTRVEVDEIVSSSFAASFDERGNRR